ncbi:MAG: DUF5680 domain-containing protein [Patescibacteria group bacterium]
MDIKNLSNFLKRAKKNTYASETAKKDISQRPGSEDYEYKEGEFVYHDTYFGRVNFIGEEVVYKKGKPIWGMNYNGHVVGGGIAEADINKSLRVALRQDYDDMIPVRGPRYFRVENYEYKNNVSGGLDEFEGREEILKNGKRIYRALFHGGLIK